MTLTVTAPARRRAILAASLALVSGNVRRVTEILWALRLDERIDDEEAA